MVTFGRGWTSRFASNFAQAEAQSHDRIDEVNAEWFIHQPMCVEPNYPQGPDPKRKIVRIFATFVWPSHMQRLGMVDIQVVTRKPRLIVNRYRLTQPIKVKDLLIRECDETLFEAHAPERDGLSGLEIELTQLGKQV